MYLLLCAPHSVTVQPPDRTSALAVTTIVCLGNSKKIPTSTPPACFCVYVSLLSFVLYFISDHISASFGIYLYLYDECVRLVVWLCATVTVVFILVSYFHT
uniref:Uncharacterized protein n=1 Tax=Schizaphis graminum TaxID=13262 RepID=A0A2S2PAM9_SCHGA